MTRLVSMLAGIALLASAQAFAEQNLVGDAEAGKAKSATCAACHGADGISSSPQWPHLAGQVPGYIATQLEYFQQGAEGPRENAIMAGMVAALSPQDIADLDAYFVSLPAHKGSITPEQEELALAGQQIYKAGEEEFSVPACMGCHLPNGAGIAPAYPRLAGLPKEYVQAQLLAYKSGARQNPMMNPIAYPLSEAQIEALATYISGLN